MKCPYCGNEQPGTEFCSKCGANLKAGAQPNQQNQNYGYNQNPYGQQQYYQQPGQQQGGGNMEVANAEKKAKNALIFGILGLICLMPLGIVAIVMGIPANKTLKQAGVPSGNAVAGIVLGILAIVFWVIGIIIWIVYIDMLMAWLGMAFTF